MNPQETPKPNIVHKINEHVMQVPYFPTLEAAAGVHVGLNAFYLQMKQEMHNLREMQLKARREKMLELFIRDFLQESKELDEVQIGYINTHATKRFVQRNVL